MLLLRICNECREQVTCELAVKMIGRVVRYPQYATELVQLEASTVLSDLRTAPHIHVHTVTLETISAIITCLTRHTATRIRVHNK